MSDYINIKLVQGFSNALILLSYKHTVRFILIIFPLIKLLVPGKYKTFQKNHKAAFPEKNAKEIAQLAKGSLRSMYVNYAVSLKYLKHKNFDKKVVDTFLKEAKVLDNSLNKRPIIFIAAHIGISILGPSMFSKYYKVNCIVPIRNYKNTKIGEYLTKFFTNEYCEVVELGGTMPKIENVLQNNGILILGMDSKVDSKYSSKVKFFNHDFNMVNTVEFLAKKYNALVIPIYGTFDEKYFPVIKILEPIDLNHPEPMQVVANSIEKMIRMYPHNWNLADDYFN